MKAFLKENMVLAAGIALPLLLALIFFGATQMGKATIDPPRYSVIFAADYYHNNNNYPYNLVIEKDQLRFVYIPPEEKDSYHNWQKPRLFVYNPVKNESHEVALPNIKDKKKKIDEVIEDIHAQKLSSLKESPDGFVFDRSAVLIGGDPGIGKSTLLLQLVCRLSQKNTRCVYVSGEESVDQVRMRAQRLELAEAPVQLASATSIRDILASVEPVGDNGPVELLIDH